MLLFNPKKYQREHADEGSRELVEKTIAFFENKGLKRIKEDDQAMVWYEDFLAFIKEEKIFADLLTPAAYGEGETGRRWDMWRISEFNEVLAFYGLCYWYAWQVTILGLGPIWMGENEEVKKKTARAAGGRRGLRLRPVGEDPRRRPLLERDDPRPRRRTAATWPAARNTISATATAPPWSRPSARFDGSGEYVFFVVDPQHPNAMSA